MNSKDFVPDSYKNIKDWLANLIAEAPAQLALVGWDATRISGFTGALTPFRDQLQEILDLKQELDNKTAAFQQQWKTALPGIRNQIDQVKGSPGFNDGIGDTLEIMTKSSHLDPATYKPKLMAKALRGHVELMGKKLGVDALNIYMRRKGETQWTRIFTNRLRFPVEDDTPAKVPGTPEDREYKAVGVVGDNEFGNESDIVSAIYAG